MLHFTFSHVTSHQPFSSPFPRHILCFSKELPSRFFDVNSISDVNVIRTTVALHAALLLVTEGLANYAEGLCKRLTPVRTWWLQEWPPHCTSVFQHMGPYAA